MQPAVQLLLAGWHNHAGWMLIVTGTALAVHTLGFRGVRPRAAHILRAYRPAEWCQRQSAHGRVRPMKGEQQWRKLTAIAERGFAQAEAAAELHARAQQELEAVEDALIRLLAEHARGNTLPQPQPDTASLPASAPAPLAA